MSIEEIRIAPRSPWRNCYVERLIGSIRRECLNHVIVINDNHLRRLLKDYFRYYHESRTHLSLNKDAHQIVEQFNRTSRTESFRFRKSVDSTIDMSDAPRRQ
jgi:hypothetical protein